MSRFREYVTREGEEIGVSNALEGEETGRKRLKATRHCVGECLPELEKIPWLIPAWDLTVDGIGQMSFDDRGRKWARKSFSSGNSGAD